MNTPNIPQNIDYIKQLISETARLHGRNKCDIRLIAVSKTRPADAVNAALKHGQFDFGENTLQDAQTKIPHFEKTDSAWHFIGHLQSKKSKYIAQNFSWLHTLDSLKLAQCLQNNAEKADKKLNCLLQINITQDTAKYGLTPGDVYKFIEQLLDSNLNNIKLRGLMTIGKKYEDIDDTRKGFSQLRELQEKCKQEFRLEKFDHLSMGMSNDFKQAIAEGATMVRIGTHIFGKREYSL